MRKDIRNVMKITERMSFFLFCGKRGSPHGEIRGFIPDDGGRLRQQISIHDDEVAGASGHDEQMEDLMAAEVLMSAVE